MLSLYELSGMRAAATLLMPDACYLLTASGTPNGYGEITQTWGTTGTTVCRLDMKMGYLQSNMMKSGAGMQSFSEYIVTLPYDTVVDTNTRISHNGNIYSVQSVNEDISWPIVKRCIVEAV